MEEPAVELPLLTGQATSNKQQAKNNA